MAEPYRFQGQSGLFFKELYGSQTSRTRLEKAMAQVCPCLFYFNGTCSIKADVYSSDEERLNTAGEDIKTPCVGAKVRCPYYTGLFKYLTKEYVEDGKPIIGPHIIEIFGKYLNYSCSYEVVKTFTETDGISSFWKMDDSGIILPWRTTSEDGDIVYLPYHPQSNEYKYYLDFIDDVYFKRLFPRIIYPPINEEGSCVVYQNEDMSVLLDVPRDGYTYVIYLSELNLSDKTLSIIDGFFKTGKVNQKDKKGNIIKNEGDVSSLSYFFKQMFTKLNDTQNSELIVSGASVGFGVALATLSSKYDLSKNLIIYSESDVIFNDDLFDLDEIYIGMFSMDETYSMNLEMNYCDINISSNCIYDLATGPSLDAEYDDRSGNISKVKGAYGGQDIAFGAKVSLTNKREEKPEETDIEMTAVSLPWYYSDETTKKYLWSLNSKEEEYTVKINHDCMEQDFELGRVTVFKNIIILEIKDSTFPFYIKDCKYNKYDYVTKYQTYHPMFEFGISSDFSFEYGRSYTVDIEDIETAADVNTNRTQSGDSRKETKGIITLLDSLPCGTVILVPDINGYLSDFIYDNAVELKFTLVTGESLEYLPDSSQCKNETLLIPGTCYNIEEFRLKNLAAGRKYESITIVEKEVEEEGDDSEDELDISLSNIIKGQPKQEYYVEIICDIETDSGAGAIYKQEDIKEILYFYSSYCGFEFFLKSVSGDTEIKEENYDEERQVNVRIECEKEDPDYDDSENINNLLSGKRPLLSVDDLGMEQAEYDFKYLYEKTTRSFINNTFYQPFSEDFLLANRGNEWVTPFTKSVSDFYILKALDDKNKPDIEHNLTHILNSYSFFGLSVCGFSTEKLKFDNILDNGAFVIDKFQSIFDKFFYFYIFGISKFVQDYMFLIKYKNNIIPILKRIPVIVSQVGVPDPEIKYKWKSKCSVYTYLYDTGLNPFEKIYDSDNLNFFVNPFYVIVHRKYRDDKYLEDRTSTEDYGYLFTSDWWKRYKKTMDSYGYITIKMDSSNNPNIRHFLDIYRTLADTGSSIPNEEDIIKGFSKIKDVLYIELESIEYVYSSYCGDHDFTVGNTTPYLYDRASDVGLSSPFMDVINNRELSGIYYTGDYDKSGIGMRRSRPCSRFIGSMWFPFRACEVARYNEFADYPGVRNFIKGSDVYRKSLRGFSCTDLIFKPYNNEDIKFSDCGSLFIDDCFGSINPYRYVSSFYSIDIMKYYESSSSSTLSEIAPTYIASNASIPWRFVPVLFKDNNEYVIAVINPRDYTIIPVTSGTLGDMDDVENYVVFNVGDYKNFVVGETGIEITKKDLPESGKKRSILYNCVMDTPPMLPYNYKSDKYICGYERMRGGDANFIYQCLYPYHHNHVYFEGCKCAYDYKNKGEESYGEIDNTLLPAVMSPGTIAEEVISSSVFMAGYCVPSHAPGPIPGSALAAWDWLNQNVPNIMLGCLDKFGKYSKVAEKYKVPWNESEYSFWEHLDTIGCETDGPTIMKMCLNNYTYSCYLLCTLPGGGTSVNNCEFDIIGSAFIDENTDCTGCYSVPECEKESCIVVSSSHSETNVKSTPLYYHFASNSKEAYDYVFLGASMENKPYFCGDGAMRMFENDKALKDCYNVFGGKSVYTDSVDAFPIFGGLGKFFRMCYFSTNYGKVPFGTISGTNTESEKEEDRHDNYVYELSGYPNSDVVFDNDFEYGYLPEKNLVFVTKDVQLFTSLVSFTKDDTVVFDVRNCVRFRDLVFYKNDSSEEGYYKYKSNDILLYSFGAQEPVESGPAFTLLYDMSVKPADKYNYYSNYCCKVYIEDPIIDDDGVVIDPFPFGKELKIKYKEMLYADGYLKYDTVTLKITELSNEPCEPYSVTIKIKERPGNMPGFPWMFCVESEEEIVNGEGNTELKTVDIQKIYLTYDTFYQPGKFIEEDKNDEFNLNMYDVIRKGNKKYKINRGFYLDLTNMFLPFSTYTTTRSIFNLNKSDFNVENRMWAESECYCFDSKGALLIDSPYIEMGYDCFIISLEGNVILSNPFNKVTNIGYMALETDEEYYAIGNIVATPNLDDNGDNIKVNGKYHYDIKLVVYPNYNKVKYCGEKYIFSFKQVVYFCDSFGGSYVDIKCGRFTGGEICNIKFNEVSSLKAITYSSDIGDVLSVTTDGIDLYNENLNDKLMVDDPVFYAMPLGFVHKLAGGISKDKEIEFNDGYRNEFSGLTQEITYDDDKQKFLDKIVLPVERDVFNLINYPSCSVEFCLKSEVYNKEKTEFNASLVPDLCKIFSYIPIKQWVAPGHRLDLYPDSLYAEYNNDINSDASYLMKAFVCTDKLDSYKNDLNVLACGNEFDEKLGNSREFLEFCGISKKDWARDTYFVTPRNVLFITHVDHGMFGYNDITDVSTWIDEPSKPTVYGFYDEKGEPVENE